MINQQFPANASNRLDVVDRILQARRLLPLVTIPIPCLGEPGVESLAGRHELIRQEIVPFRSRR